MTVFGLGDLAFLGAVTAGYTPTDAAAAAYITAVEAADGQKLEPGVRQAIDEFVVGCKADGIWTAIKASCILAGARTLAGALVPLVGTAPTSFNFVAGDYNRKTGLVGDGTTKYLNSNRNNNADPQNSKHVSVYATAVGTSNTATRAYIGTQFNSGWTSIIEGGGINNTNQVWINAQVVTTNRISNSIGLIGASRSNNTEVIGRNGSSNVFSQTSQAPQATAIFVFAGNGSGERTNARLAFYSIGEALDLALLDARVTTLINAFAAAIP